MNKGTIIFDFDGTVADSFDVVADIFYQLTGKERFSDERIAELRKLSLNKIGKEIGISLRHVPRLLVKGRALMKHRMREVKPVPGMLEALRDLHNEGWRLMVISTNSRQNVEEYLHEHKLDKYFDHVHGSVGLFGKTRALNKVIKQNKVDRHTCFYVGDEIRDLQSAHKARIGSVAVTWGFNDSPTLHSEKPTAVAETPAQLVEIFAKQLL
jgi:phosphoglycolate phosphatase